jgi:phosphoglycerate dehydrogenase-like enzyme
LPNCYLTPHRAGGTIASVGRIIDYLIDDLEAFWTGNPLRHQLTQRMIASLDA